MNTASWNLENLTARRQKAIAPRKKPYFKTISSKLCLGYIKRPGGAVGSWVARREIDRKATQPGTKQYTYARYEQWTLGAADDLVPADGVTVLSCHQAMTKAQAEHHARQTGRVSAIVTVADAITYYLDGLEQSKGERARMDAHGKLRKHVLKTPLADRPLATLTHTNLDDWKKSAIVTTKGEERERKSKDSWNRVWASFRAALNVAYGKKAVTTDEAWRAIKRFPKVARPRTHHFTMAEACRVIALAEPPAFRQFLEAAFLTGARAGELRELDVQHFNAATGQLAVVAERAGAKKTGPRSIALTAEAVTFFAALAEGREPDAPLLLDPHGARWPIGGQKKPMRRALKRAGLFRKDARGNTPTFYSTRHTVISRTREQGAPDWLIARNVGTSPKMIEDSYGKITPETQRAMIEQFTPKLREVARDVA